VSFTEIHLLWLKRSASNEAKAHHELRESRRILLPIRSAASQNLLNNQQVAVSLPGIDKLLSSMPIMPSNRLPNLPLSRSDRAEPAKVWKARSYIQDHLEEELSLRIVAKFVQISPNHLSETFKEVTGVNFVEYIARRRFAKACLLLLDPDLKISEIAFEVGFQSLSQFNRVFRKFSGKSPTAYRAHEFHRVERAAHSPNGVAKTLPVEMRSRSAAISNTLRHREAINGHAVASRQS